MCVFRALTFDIRPTGFPRTRWIERPPDLPAVDSIDCRAGCVGACLSLLAGLGLSGAIQAKRNQNNRLTDVRMKRTHFLHTGPSIE